MYRVTRRYLPGSSAASRFRFSFVRRHPQTTMNVKTTGRTSVSNSGMWKYVSDVEVFQYSPQADVPYVALCGARTMIVGLSEDVPTASRVPSTGTSPTRTTFRWWLCCVEIA